MGSILYHILCRWFHTHVTVVTTEFRYSSFALSTLFTIMIMTSSVMIMISCVSRKESLSLLAGLTLYTTLLYSYCNLVHHDHDIICNDYDHIIHMCKQKRSHFTFGNGTLYTTLLFSYCNLHCALHNDVITLYKTFITASKCSVEQLRSLRNYFRGYLER